MFKNRVFRVILISISALSIALPTSSAVPTVDLETVERQVDQLQRQAASAAEDWNQSRLELAKVEAKIAALKDTSAAQKVEREVLMADLTGVIRAMYVSGGMDLDFQAFMAENPQDFLLQLDALSIVGKRQQISIRRLEASNVSIATTRSSLLAERKKARALASKASKQLKAIQSKLDEAERLLNSLEAADRRAREAKLAAARKKQAEEAKKSTAKVTTGISNTKIKKVLSYALNQVGDDYRMGATGPSAYDCSGLTMMSYRQAGVSLSHFSGSQWSQTRRVSKSQLRPGDLVFFFKGIRHVGIYIGNNRMVHAANYGTGVIISSLSESYYASRLSGYGRVIN